ncbi:MAG: 30S ribosomal protein S7 [Candidatus Aminicenantes bacterium]|nr:30S ribosomal protein S7 [Candidatus Aminicenantes bacterium]
MPRRGIIKKRRLAGDQKYGSTLVTKFVNTVMKRGKRSTAEGIVYRAMDIVKTKAKDDPLKVFEKSVDNVRPMVETKSRRVGGATYQVPVEVETGRSVSVGVRWMIKYASERGGKNMADKLAAEVLDAASGKGGAVKKREDTHKMAEANRAFAHYRW